MTAFFGAMASGEFNAIHRFIQDNFTAEALERPPSERRATLATLLARRAGRLAPVAIERSSADELIVTACGDRSEECVRCLLQVEAVAPFRITKLELSPTMRPASQRAAAPGTAESIAAGLDTYLARLEAADVFSGAVLVSRGTRPIFQQAYGSADPDRRVPNRLETRFNIGSMNKMLTAVAVGQLVEQGRLAWTDPIARYLPDYPDQEIAQAVNVHHLLTHTSGLGTYFGPKFWQRKDKLSSLPDYLGLIAGEPLRFKPGERFFYSNSGFVLLGRILEVITGQDYYDYMRTQVFARAGMMHTEFCTPDASELASGMTFIAPTGPQLSRSPNLSALPPRGTPDGGGCSTVGDLAAFGEALREGRLLKPETLRVMTEAKVDVQPGFRYGYGFGIHEQNGLRYIGHNGGAPGVNARLDIYPDAGYTVVVLSNYDDPAAEVVAARARALIGGW